MVLAAGEFLGHSLREPYRCCTEINLSKKEAADGDAKHPGYIDESIACDIVLIASGRSIYAHKLVRKPLVVPSS